MQMTASPVQPILISNESPLANECLHRLVEKFIPFHLLQRQHPEWDVRAVEVFVGTYVRRRRTDALRVSGNSNSRQATTLRVSIHIPGRDAILGEWTPLARIAAGDPLAVPPTVERMIVGLFATLARETAVYRTLHEPYTGPMLPLRLRPVTKNTTTLDEKLEAIDKQMRRATACLNGAQARLVHYQQTVLKYQAKLDRLTVRRAKIEAKKNAGK